MLRVVSSRPIVGTSVIAAALACCLGWSSSARADEYVQACGSSFANDVFASTTVSGITATAQCPTAAYNGAGFGLFNAGSTSKGQAGRWQANTPPGLEIVGATAAQISSTGINDNGDYGGGFYWSGGGLQTNNQTDLNPFAVMTFAAPSGYFGMQLVCGKATCGQPAQLAVGALSLDVRETTAPTLSAPTGLWAASGWVRGSWPLTVSADSPSGVCLIAATFAGQGIPGSTSAATPPTWHQCSAPPLSQTINTANYDDGGDDLHLAAYDAAGLTTPVDKTVDVDNQGPTIQLSGPADAPSTAGTQYVTATATAGPAGIAGISCTIDNGPAQWYPAATTQIPVAGIGEHSVQCQSENNAVDATGQHGMSFPATFTVKIGTPTVASVAFSRLVDKLSCHRTIERVRIPARWVKVRLHGKLVRVHDPAHTERVTITHCHVRTVRRHITVTVTVRRHGRLTRVKRRKTVRVLLHPHRVEKTTLRVAHGRAAFVHGWLGTTTGVALADQIVEVLTAADNGRNDYRVATVVKTAANGAWTARLPAGPSRLITANYAGGPTTENALAAPAHLVVPADVELLSVSPRRIPWGGTVRLVGRLNGGYLPRGGALLRLRIGEGSAVTTYGVREHVSGDGRFSTTYTFGAGEPSAFRSFWFQVASLPMGDYPYAPANSRRASVVVGGHPRHGRSRRAL
jgi:hypothetical protein